MIRKLATGFVAIAAFYLTLWLFGALLLPENTPLLIRAALSVAGAWYAGRFTWRRMAAANNGALRSIALGAFIVGGISFCAGFFGPLIFAPEANQGPLLGILITGQLGFLAGAVGGLVYWWWNRGQPRRG
jgi:hypothetical protein